MLVPKNEPFSLIELIDKIPLEKTGIRNSLFAIRNDVQANSNTQIEYIESWGIFIYFFALFRIFHYFIYLLIYLNSNR